MVKNENQLLGVIIQCVNSKNECGHSKIVEQSGLDWDSYSFILKELEEKHYLRSDSEGVHLFSLGIANYISKKDKVLSWLVTLLKFAVSYTLGIFSGIIAAWLMIKLGIG